MLPSGLTGHTRNQTPPGLHNTPRKLPDFLGFSMQKHSLIPDDTPDYMLWRIADSCSSQWPTDNSLQTQLEYRLCLANNLIMVTIP
jgi:hypothetical protein